MSHPFSAEPGSPPPYDWDAAEQDVADLDAIDYGRIPTIARRWLWPGYLPFGNPVIFAAKGETGKGMLFCTVAARVALGLPFPGEDQAKRYAPARVVWIAGSEDDQFEDMAPRLRAAITHAVAEFQLPAALAGEDGAIKLIHDLSEWRDGSPFGLPGDVGRLLTEVNKLSALDQENRGPKHPDYAGPAFPVRLVVMDPLADLLGEHDTIATVKGARRLLRPVKMFARKADVALVLIHHLTADGKVAGSPAVLDALRLAFVVERRTDNPACRVITRRKGNISVADPQQYTITGQFPATHVEFLSATDARAARVEEARDRGELEQGLSVHERARAAAAAGAYSASAATRYKLLRAVMSEDDGPGPRETPRLVDSEQAAKAAAEHDAGRPLAWKASATNPARLTAAFKEGGEVRSYAVYPAS